MARAIHVLLPTCAHHLAATVLEAGGVPILDATVQAPAQVPDGAWVRIRPGQPAPGRGPVILAEDGAPVLDRPTWLEVASVHEVPPGFAGLVLKGSEAGGLCGEQSGVEMLAAHPQPDRVLVDAGLGPTATAAIGALGGAGVVICGPLLALPAFGLASALRRRLEVPDDEITHLVSGWRVGNPAVAPVLRQLAHGEDPWRLARQAWSSGDLREALWLIDQGAALATYIAETHHDVADAIATYDRAFSSWGWRATKARPAPVGRDVGSGAALQAHNAVAAPGGTVGLGVLWEQAARLGRPIRGPLRAAVATGLPLVAEPEAIEAARSALTKLAAAKGLPTSEPQTPAAPSDPAPPPAPSPSPPPSDDAPPGPPVPSDEPVAIIGLGCRLPGAHDVGAFWSNVQAGISAIIEVPSDRWAVERYYDPDPAAPDKTYSRIGGFLQGFTFDNRRFRVPPKVVPSLDPVQQITLHAVDDALRDAGLQADPRKPEGRPFSRERCAVILGNSLGGEIKDDYALRVAWPEIEAQLGQSPDIQALSPDRQRSLLQELRRAFKASLPPITEDSMPGELSNVIAGRVANAFDLRGANFTTDAACASSLAALQAAVQGLQRHDFDLAISGGADRSMNPSTYVKFCKIGALSPDRSTPFDKDANGFVMGEGVGVFVLKRLRDAVSDGDKVYAVIRGIGASSDGRGKGITAPNPRGQELALQRAYDQAGLDPAQVDLIEAHGTSTAVGDGVELNTLSAFIGQGKRGDRGPVRVGSVKSMIGHLKSAAGAAALIKAALAVYHGVLPPSLGFKEARPDVDLAAVPLQVQTRTEPWPATPDGVRRAGISAFGFGGTNFHVVIESWAGQPVPRRGARPRPALPRPRPMASSSLSSNEIVMAERPLPDGLWATSALDKAGLIQNLHRLRQGQPVPWHPSDPVRVAAAARDPQERASQIDRALKVLERDQSPDLLRARNVYVEDAPNDGKVAFLFTGQGSQYLDMGLDLAAAFPLVQRTFDEADQIVRGALGQGITDFIRSNPAQDRAEQERILQRTEISQPATLTVDVAILRLLASYGVYPDMVAGHSLGEYAACVAAGVMSFEQALHAVSARGREMASIRIDDPGKMAGVAASTDVVEELLAEIDGYVIAANKNCPTQTVIAGASDAVDEAVERFQARGLTVYRLPVSHAFHSRIVAPATEPLKVVLERLGLQAPRRPITTNVTSDYYPTGPDAATKAIELLGEQISAPVEWTSQIDRMYADGARLFVECGPKRALTGFVVSILKRRPHRAFYTNHPKRGGAQSFRDALAGLTAAGLPVRAEPSAQLPDLFATPAPRTATTEAVTARLALVEQITEATPDVTAGILRIVAAKTGYETVDLDLDFELEADLGIDTVKQAEIFAVVRETYGIAPDPSFSFADHRSLRSVIDWAAARIGATRPQVPQREPAPPADDDAIQSFLLEAAKAGMHGLDAEAFARALLPSVQGLIQAAFDAAHPSASPQSPPEPTTASPPTRKAPAPAPTRATSRPSISAPSPAWPQVVCTGASVGLPGGEEVFGPDNLARLLRGENRIGALGDRADRFLDMNIVRLRKDPTTGSGTFALVTDRSDVIKLAGQAGRFDLTEWGLPADRIEAFDITTRLAMAATFEALRDAGIPLQRTTKTTASGKVVPTGWALPEPLRDETGVIFASAFPGYDQLVQHLERRAEEPGAPFDRRFLFQVLAMGHSQIAQAIGARGPNTQINAACASPAQATAIAQDWLRVGRCRRVVVVSADNVTSEALLPWIGGGFLAAGAASIADRPEEAALPFDARRHGLVLGMGAHGMVLETAEAAAERGITPIAELLESVFVNSAFHGTRLHPSHIREVVQGAVHQTCQRLGISPQAFAREGLFMSHETYTPARGGSAQAEIEALRSAFGEAAGEITIANTKGYTGHPMSAGIEDTVTVKALQYGQLPPIANFRDPDPALGDLRLAKGERRRVRYALRLAAGFGSQLACTLWRGIAVDDDRDDLERRRAWLHRVTGYDRVREEIGQRTLRVVPSDTDLLLPLRPQVSPAGGQAELRPVSVPQSSVAPAPAAPPARPSSATSPTAILQELTQLVAEKT
ncbi:MAG: acyltransferase domain-containing protein, partial [Deltaproteobacteria bacterium]